MRNQHRWGEKGEDGIEIKWQATKFAGRWEIKCRGPETDGWEIVKNPSAETLENLRELLWRKYQRKRLAYEDVLAIEKWRDQAKREEAAG